MIGMTQRKKSRIGQALESGINEIRRYIEKSLFAIDEGKPETEILQGLHILYAWIHNNLR